MHVHCGYREIQNRVFRFSFPLLFLTLLLMQLRRESTMSVYGKSQHSAPVPGLVGQTADIAGDNVTPKPP